MATDDNGGMGRALTNDSKQQLIASLTYHAGCAKMLRERWAAMQRWAYSYDSRAYMKTIELERTIKGDPCIPPAADE